MTCRRHEVEGRFLKEVNLIPETDPNKEIIDRIASTSYLKHPVLSKLVFESGLLVIDLSKDLKAAGEKFDKMEAKMLAELEYRKLLQETVAKEKERHYTYQKEVANLEKACETMAKRLATTNSTNKFLRRKLTEARVKKI